MDILLVNPPFTERTYTVPPLGLAYIAAVLRKENHRIRILDMAVYDDSYKQLILVLNDFKPDIVGITTMTPRIYEAVKVARCVRKHSDPIIIMGGPHVTVMPGETLREVKEVDIVVRAEGEETMKELVKAIDTKKPISKIKGITYRSRNGEIIANPDRPLIENLDLLPFPARDLLPMDKYRHSLESGSKFATMITSRGCPFNCIYCVKSIFGNKYRMRSANNIFAEIKEVVEKYGVKSIIFYDDTLTINKKRILELCDLIDNSNIKIKWKCECRVDTVDEEILSRMKKSGCKTIAFGVETGSEELLKVINKGTTKEKIRKAFRLCKKTGIETVAYLMIGIPGETRKTIQETLDFAIELDPDYAQFAIATPFPKTELYNIARKEGYLSDFDWSQYSYFGDSATPVMRTKELTSEELKTELKRISRAFYLRKRYILKRIRKSMSLEVLVRNIRGALTLVKWQIR